MGQVLALHLEPGLVEHRLVEDAPLGHADLAQDLAHRLGLEFLHPREVDLRDRRPLLDEYHEDVLVHLEADVLEETGGVQRAQRALRLLLGHGLAHLHRQVAEYRAGLGALQALDADVSYRERLKRLGVRGGRHGQRARGDYRGQASANHQLRIFNR